MSSSTRAVAAGSGAATARGSRGVKRHAPGPRVAPYGFVLPYVGLFLLFVVTPIIFAGYNSLFRVERNGLGLGGDSHDVFFGLGNYALALSKPEFVESFGRVLLFGAVQVPTMLGFALVLALIFDTELAGRLKALLQLIVFLPFVVPSVVAALLWAFLYQPGVSPIVDGLAAVGVHMDFLSPSSVLWSIANVNVWAVTGVNMIILYAALQTIPKDLYEAARLDGAGELRTALRIKVPMVAPAIFLTLIFSIIGTIQLYNEPTVIRSITANVSANYTPNMAVFEATTRGGNINLGSAMAIIVGLVIFVVSVVATVPVNRWRKRVAL